MEDIRVKTTSDSPATSAGLEDERGRIVSDIAKKYSVAVQRSLPDLLPGRFKEIRIGGEKWYVNIRSAAKRLKIPHSMIEKSQDLEKLIQQRHDLFRSLSKLKHSVRRSEAFQRGLDKFIREAPLFAQRLEESEWIALFASLNTVTRAQQVSRKDSYVWAQQSSGSGHLSIWDGCTLFAYYRVSDPRGEVWNARELVSNSPAVIRPSNYYFS